MQVPPALHQDDIGEDSELTSLNWRDHPETMPLDVHEEHNIWRFVRSETIETKEQLEYTPAAFGDLNPTPNGPDPEVWPLEGWDPGAPAPIEDLIPRYNAFPVPHVAWVTKEWIKQHDMHDSRFVELGYRDLAPWQRPDWMRADDTITVSAGGSPMTLNEDRLTALRRLARLWNVRSSKVSTCSGTSAPIGKLSSGISIMRNCVGSGRIQISMTQLSRLLPITSGSRRERQSS